MTKINNIARNTSYLTLALIFQKILSFTYFTLIARNIGAENLGKYYFAISLASIFAIFIDFGLSNVATREIAKNQEKAQNLMSSIIGFKIPASIIIFLVIAFVVNIFNYPDLTKNLVYLATICVILDSFSLTFFSIVRGFHNLLYESIGSVIFQLLVLVSGLSFLKMGFGLEWLMVALIIASSYYFLYFGWICFFKFKIKLTPKFDYKYIKTLFIVSIPFGMYAIFQKIYTFLDTVLLSILAGDIHVGLYQVAFKIVNALHFLPMAFTAALYPAFATYWVKNRQQLTISFERAMNYLIIIAMPIAAGIICLADKIILIFKQGEFSNSIIPLQIIMVAVIFIFLNHPIGSLLNASDNQKFNTKIMGIGLLASIILNIILIPHFHTSGASTTVVITNFLMFAFGIKKITEITDYSKTKLLKIFIKTIVAALSMGALAIYLKTFLSIFIVIPICGVVYFTILFVLGGYKKEDIFSILQLLKVKK